MDNDTVDLPALRAYRLARVREQLRAHDYAGIVLFDSINVRYATDSTNMMVWTLHNPVRCTFVPAEGPVVFFEFSHCDHLSVGLGTVDEVRPAIAWFYFVSGSRTDEKAKVWAAEIADGITVHDGLEVMEQAKEIKSADEIDAMRASIAACEAGMDAMREALRPGITE